jgi:hypothetical protein
MSKKVSLLDPFVPSFMVQHYIFSVSGKPNKDGKFTFSGKPDLTIKPTRAFCILQSPNQVVIENIKIGNENVLTCDTFDAYFWSQKYSDESRLAFMKEFGVKTIKELDVYCDKNDIEIPDPNRVDFPTIEKGTSIEIKGFYGLLPVTEMFTLSFGCIAKALE